MIRILLIGIALINLAQATSAQDVRLRSGEHGSFTRLTLNMPSRLDWSVAGSENGASVRFGAEGLTVDVSGVFERIPRERITGIRWNDDGKILEIDFGCDCLVRGFWHDRAMLVLDVSEAPDDAVYQEISTSNVAPLELRTRPPSRSTELLVRSLSAGLIEQDPQITSSIPQAEFIDATRDRLLTQFSRAASQGLLTPQQTLTPTTPSERPSDRSMRDTHTPHEIDTQREVLPAQINLRAQSSIDRDFLEVFGGLAGTSASPECLPDERVDITRWGTDEPFGAQVSQRNISLTGEFDNVNPDVAMDLARLYLFFGFGTEARNILDMLPEATSESHLLRQMAEISDQGFADPNPSLAGQLDCDSSAALWSALSYKALPTNVPINTNAILRSFSALPPHSRSHLGPFLTHRFLDAGHSETATRLLRILERTDQSETPEENLANARADDLNGNARLADQRREKVVEGNSHATASALIDLIESRTKRGEDISFEQAQLVASYEFELRNDPIAPKLAFAHIRALAASGAFGLAFERLSDEMETSEPEDQLPLISFIFARLTEKSDDITFLRHVFDGKGQYETGLEPVVSENVARRLVDLGFPDQAASVLSAAVPSSRSASTNRQLLRAEIALLQDRPRQALVELLELDGKEANLLRAKALSTSGEHDAASDLFDSAGQTERARREAWLQGDWQKAASLEEPAIEALARLRSSRDPESDPFTTQQSELERNRALIDESQSVRETINALMTANPLPEAVSVIE